MSSEYPTFMYNNESIIIKPGEEFTINDLKIRLKLLGIDADNIQNKKYLIQLYDSALKFDEKKIQIFYKLKEDTQRFNTNKTKLDQKNIISLEVNYEKDKEINIQNKSNNEKVQLLRANKITEKTINNNENYLKGENKFKKIFKKIISHIFLGIIIFSSALCFLYLYRIFSEEINKIISLFFGMIANIDIHWFLIGLILVLIFLIIITKIFEKNNIKKRCNKIIKDMKENNEELSDEEIYKRYIQDYGVNYDKFKKKYMPVLKKMKK